MDLKPAAALSFPDRILLALLKFSFRLLQSVVDIRVGMLTAERLGHLVLDAEDWMRSSINSSRGIPQISLFFCGRSCNPRLLGMLKRQMSIWSGLPALRLYELLTTRVLPAASRIEFKKHQEADWEMWTHGRPNLTFTTAEKREGEALLRSMGIPEGSPFVCIHTRDSAYLEDGRSVRSRMGDWRYHDYRDGQIENYLPAAEWLADQGFFVLRMGAVVERPIPSRHPRVIDYASRHRTDLGDVYLMANCRFYIGSTSGLLVLAMAFNIPYVMINTVPLMLKASSARDLFILKKYRSIRENRILTFPEIFSSGGHRWMTTASFERAEIELVENSAEEILAVTREMKARLDGTWVSTPEDELLQARFDALFPPASPYAGHPSRIGAEFLRRNADLLEAGIPAGARKAVAG
ncbi:TIGR04372 family glycosyltransferase [bacterium]|nr:TIGR04372 family glycosyltransferase [bacterium]